MNVFTLEGKDKFVNNANAFFALYCQTSNVLSIKTSKDIGGEITHLD